MQWKFLGRRGQIVRQFSSARGFWGNARCMSTLAALVSGSDAGPWLKGLKEEHAFWVYLFEGNHNHYQARKGVTAD